jgi:GntR family transcriptional regulator
MDNEGDNVHCACSGHRYVARVFEVIDGMADVPVWIQLYELLKTGIEDGTYPPRTPLPSARTIQQESGLARATIAKAFDRLRDEGYVRIVPGRGPFVAPRTDS